MRVVEVISGLGLGGAERALLQRLGSRSGIETLVVSTRPDLDDLELMVRAKADFVAISAGRWRSAKILSVIQQWQPDVVVIHNPLEGLRLLRPWARPISAPVVSIAHSDRVTFNRWLEPMLNRVVRAVNRRAAGHLAVSSRAAAGAQCDGSRKVAVVHLGATLAAESGPVDAWPPASLLRWLTVGRFVLPKNYLTLIEAVASVADPLRDARAHLLIVGYGPEGAAMSSRLIERGIDDLVSIRERVPDASGLFLAADACVISSVNEGGPLAAYEAALAGCRIAGTSVGVVPEVLADDDGSVLFRSPSTQDLAAGLLQLVALGAVSASERTDRQALGQRWSAETCGAVFYDALANIAFS